MTATPLPPDPLASAEADLSAIDAAPLAEQAEIFERVHRAVSRVLDSTVDRSGPAAPGGSPSVRPAESAGASSPPGAGR